MELFLLINEADGRRRLSVVVVISCLLLLSSLLSSLLTLERFTHSACRVRHNILLSPFLGLLLLILLFPVNFTILIPPHY